MKNLVAKAGVAAVGSAILLVTAGAKSAKALYIPASETFSVSEDVCYNPLGNGCLGTGSSDRQFRSYNPNPNTVNGRYTSDDSIISSLQSNPINAGGDVTNMATVGSFTSEEMRGMTEFNLAPYYQFLADLAVDPRFTPSEKADIKAQLIASAALNFEVFNQGGLEPDNQHPLALPTPSRVNGAIQVSYYQGDGLESLADYGNGYSKSNNNQIIPGTPATPLDLLFTQDFVKGQKVSFDISLAVADALNQGWQFLGLRLEALPAKSNPNPIGYCAFDSRGQATGLADCGAITFNNFAIGAVPTPAAILPTLLGMGMAAIRKRKNKEEITSDI